MKTINILAAHNTIASNMFSVVDFVQFANAFWSFLHPDAHAPILDYRLYSNEGNTIQFSNGLSLPSSPLEEYSASEAIYLVPAFSPGPEALNRYASDCQRFAPILQAALSDQTWIATNCTGAFGLAACGVLDNRKATTAWWFANYFQHQFPAVDLSLDEIVVEDNPVITGGATTSYLNVCMRLLETLTDGLFAAQLAKLLLLDRHRLSQQAFVSSQLIVNKRDDLVEKIQQWMFENFAQSISLDDLCDRFAVTKRTLIRRFKAACQDTPLNYLQKIRVEKAKLYLETTALPFERIVEKVGYEDVSSFRKLFTQQAQLTPKQYRERFAMVAS